MAFKKKGAEDSAKNRAYLLTSEHPPLQLFLNNRHKQYTPCQFYDENKNKTRSLRYATNQSSVFEDEQDGDVLLGSIIFSNGKLNVPYTNPELQQFLSLHPANGVLFSEFNPEAEAVDELSVLENETKALTTAFDLSADQLESIGLALWGSSVLNKKTSEVKRDVIIYAKQNPVNFLYLVDDDLTQLKALSAKAVDLGLVQYKDFAYYNNDKVLCKVPYDEIEPLNTLSRWLKTTADGNKFQEFLHSKMK